MFGAREVATIVGLAESRIRYWAQTGFVGPSLKRGGRPLYSFQDLVAVKTAKELLDRGVTMQRVRKSLEALRAQLPDVAQPLSQLRVLSDGERLVVVDDGARYEPLSGQLVLDFDVTALAGDAARISQLRDPANTDARATPTMASPPAVEARAVAAAPPPAHAFGAYRDGLRLAAVGRTDEARAAFERALALDPTLAAAHTNLGLLAHAEGRADEARAAFERALALDATQPEARYNLGNLRDEAGDTDGALAEWYQAIALDPDFADAHFNIGAALVESGAFGPGARHLERYLALRPDGDAAIEARAMLQAIEKKELS
jgi:tetratricopeptide (TPR) repeat protein